MTTPVLTVHARTRCAEMGISTKRAKRIVSNRCLTYKGGNRAGDGLVAVSDDPDYAVVYVPGSPDLIVTVLFRTDADYDRHGITFHARDQHG